MKLKFYLPAIIASPLFVACDQSPTDGQIQSENEPGIMIVHLPDSEIEIAIIDECEYILYKEENGTNLAYGYMAHKGNCSNPVHSNKITLGLSDSPILPAEQLIVDSENEN